MTATITLRRPPATDGFASDYVATLPDGARYIITADRTSEVGRVKGWLIERVNADGYSTSGLTHVRTLADVRAHLAGLAGR